jgi:methionyl-tRNA synthetase
MDKRFLPDRYIEGTCPACNYENARGDQCENCTKQLNPTDLLEPRSAISGSKDLEIRETTHLYLQQSKLKNDLDKWIKSKKDWPILTTSIAQKWLHDGEGLQDRGITRDLDWGVPVKNGEEDWPGMEKKVFYVWFDAPIEYIAATVELTNSQNLGNEAWERWWRTDKGADDVYYVQFMGKDNVPFHTLSFPSTLMGSGEPWKLVDYIKSFNYLNYDGGQFSTSQGRGIFMDQALDILPSDYWRWWLLTHVPENSDSEFTWDNFQLSINKDLADVLGNFVSRVTKFCRSKFGEEVPETSSFRKIEMELIDELQTRFNKYQTFLETLEIRKASSELRKIWVLGNEYLQKTEPWAIYKLEPKTSGMIINISINLIRLYAILSEPFIPDTSQKIMLAVNSEDWSWPNSIEDVLQVLPPKHSFNVPDVLFNKITDDERDIMQKKFSGL